MCDMWYMICDVWYVIHDMGCGMEGFLVATNQSPDQTIVRRLTKFMILVCELVMCGVWLMMCECVKRNIWCVMCEGWNPWHQQSISLPSQEITKTYHTWVFRNEWYMMFDMVWNVLCVIICNLIHINQLF